MKKLAVILLSLASFGVYAEELQAPVGVRPCCAFGMDLKAQLGRVPVPFFSLENILAADEIGEHKYNDGSESVSGSLLGFNDEVNGIIFTQLGGFIDTAHVRDTADYTYYLFHLNQQHLGQSAQVDLPAELRIRTIRWHPQPAALTPQEQIEYSAKAAALTAYRLAQWHEIAQWFGMVSVSGFKEYASAFSSEDLYSNMLGAQLARDILLEQPEVCEEGFEQAMDHAFHQALQALKVQPKSVTREKMSQLDGVWWDSSRRLPDKWVVLYRDYHLGLALKPNYPTSSHVLSLAPNFANNDAIEDWVELELHADKQERAFSQLPEHLTQMPIWRADQFQTMADFARESDRETHPHR
ncbi:hypothetical protein BIY22_01550 [Vibrio panuliri]|uniref:DUF4056 domain-containing protein n=1 Tax=Vibrio panuliri TaxID=1381081 RepID=A0A1Q9HQT4_9VIBR|nr:DUF4056 domain-containing protein [Vibrio panuliri]OLQ93203.1 hypothetical protein BIY22_01550 [Vibrio panuliri]